VVYADGVSLLGENTRTLRNKIGEGVFHNIMHKVGSGVLRSVLDLTWTGSNVIQTTEISVLKFNKTCGIIYGI
jgi:hypothetical protein